MVQTWLLALGRMLVLFVEVTIPGFAVNLLSGIDITIAQFLLKGASPTGHWMSSVLEGSCTHLPATHSPPAEASLPVV